MVNLLKDGLMKHRTHWELDLPCVPERSKEQTMQNPLKTVCNIVRLGTTGELNPLSGWMTSGVACRNHSSRPVLCVNFCVRNTEFSELKIELEQTTWFQVYSSDKMLVVDITLMFYDSCDFRRTPLKSWTKMNEVEKSPEISRAVTIFPCFDTKAVSRPFVCAGEGFELCAMFAFSVTRG